MKHLLFLPLLLTPSVLNADAITNLPADALEWEVTPEGVRFAPLIGDRFQEAYMAMVELPGGLSSPPHVKSADMFGVMVSGTMTHVAQGDDPASGTALGVGAFYHIPADVAHISTCISDTPCVAFLYQDGAFDFVPVAP